MFDKAQRRELYLAGLDDDGIHALEVGAIGMRGVKVADIFQAALRRARGEADPPPTVPAPVDLMAAFGTTDANGRERHPRDIPGARTAPHDEWFFDGHGLARDAITGKPVLHFTPRPGGDEVEPPPWARARADWFPPVAVAQFGE